MENYNFSQMKSDRLLNCVNNTNFVLRDNLNIDKQYTFGIEIEMEYCDISKIKELLIKYHDQDWIVKRDNSLEDGCEINSPILRDDYYTWKIIEDVCQKVSKKAIVGDKTSGHIHIGAPILGSNKEYWLRFLKLWATYENVIYRFAYGEYANARKCIKKYAEPFSLYLFLEYDYFKDINFSFHKLFRNLRNYERYHSVNFLNVDMDDLDTNKFMNTIEFRNPNGSFNPIIWQNNINLFMKLLLYCRSKKFNDELISKRYEKNKEFLNNLDLYKEIYLDPALELCDLIFDNNVDKLYFLKQYLKGFDNSGLYKKSNINKKIF